MTLRNNFCEINLSLHNTFALLIAYLITKLKIYREKCLK